ncbi:CRISPR-associated endonuclease Cas2 [Spirulina subsalsa FACHB-351]|uniref:CRISPR-associated endoribonuclease Cas2 n=1 Tax=Spirulina subsalsa FACHB-351 TaxID=234711 RepID=A0ABT3L9R5_9CYAN|nr:CRISPR-associated endonuclease Cas2 [Spirulina subsalsa]MCW6038249.1 CRISPR-associated endonuclease Cas2 [Spirulina subsalsa FACHB-351]
MMVYLICYDIVEDRRRTKVSNLLEAYGLRVQKSVFEAVLNSNQYQKLKGQLEGLIDLERDQLRFYPLSEHCRAKVAILGVQPDFAIDDDVLIV